MAGPNDVLGGSGKLLPRQPFPDIITADLVKRVPASVFTSNPCRIKFYSQEIVLFREDVCSKLRKFSRKPNERENDVHHHAIKTILSQGHLCPIPLEVSPIDWAYDHALRLYPLPHVLLMGCRGREFNLVERSVKVANPSSFGSDFSFAIYKPFRGEIPENKGRDHQGELEIYTLDIGAVDRQNVIEKSKEELPQKKKKKSEARRPAQTEKISAPTDFSNGMAGLKTPKEKTSRKKHTPSCLKETAVAVEKNQLQIGSFFIPHTEDSVVVKRLVGKRRLTQNADSDDSAASDGEKGLGDEYQSEAQQALRSSSRSRLAQESDSAESSDDDEEDGSGRDIAQFDGADGIDDSMKTSRERKQPTDGHAESGNLGRSRRKRIVDDEDSEEDP
jgi:hypothetical protein